MAQQQTFRSALNGFNREDVVRYIEYLNSVHAAEINQLHSELEFLRNREPVVEVMSSMDNVSMDQNNEMIQQQATRIRELFDCCKELEEKLAVAEEARAAAEEAKIHAEEKLQAVVTQQNSFQTRASEELEAYRRAERMERQAMERAESIEQQAKEKAKQIYHQSNGVLAEASVRVEEAASQIGQLSDKVLEQIAQLQSAVSGTKRAMQEASQILYTIRPQEEN